MATAVYERTGDSWMRRAWVTDSATGWAHARRLPRQVRRIGEETPPGGQLVVAFDTVTKTAKRRPQW